MRSNILTLDTLCDDLILRLAHFLALYDLLSLSSSCKNIHRIVRCSNVWDHWFNALPPAIVSASCPSSHLTRSEIVHAAMRHTLRLRSIWSGRSNIGYKQVSIPEERWCFRLSGSHWMFNYIQSSESTTVQCINLLDGSIIGEMHTALQLHGSATFNGQLHQRNEALLAMLCEETEGQTKTWSILMATTTFEDNGTRAVLNHLKTLPIPKELACLFTRFDVLQIDGDYIVLSGNWSTKAFLLIDWKRERMTVYHSIDYWRIFHWKLLGPKLFIVLDDGRLDVIDIAQRLELEVDARGFNDFLHVITLPNYRSIQFTNQGTNIYSILVVTQANGGNINIPGAPIISHFQITLNKDGTVAIYRGSFDGVMYHHESRIHIGSSGVISKEASGEVTVCSVTEGGPLCKVALNLPNSHERMELLEVDLEIGMVALRDAGYEALRAPQTQLYWIV